ncbi:cadherin-23, partial [Plakobranchus ocellatus]
MISNGFVTGNNRPNIILSKTTEDLTIPEDTKIGEIIGTVCAEDPEGAALTFTRLTQTTVDLIRLSAPRDALLPQNPNAQIVDIIVNSVLDRDYASSSSKTLFVQVSDGVTTTEVTIYLNIQDVNDVAPQFVNLPYELTIKENAIRGSVVYSGVTARDPDLGRSLYFRMEAGDAQYATTFGMNEYNGNITLLRTLDYEQRRYYQYIVHAEDDGGLAADPVGFVVYVLDVQDTPPGFINLPYSTQIDEDTPLNQPIQQVIALDGDRGIPNNITYSFKSGDFDNFEIDALTGEITISKSLDRDSDVMRDKGGVYAMIVQADEIVPQGQVNTGETTATTLVTITVLDVNDNPPLFEQQNYQASILENMQPGVPVGFQGPIMSVADIDQGTNSHFFLSLEKDGQPYYDFAPQPQDIYSESSVVIRVNNSKALDYETNKRVVFQIIAREIDTTEKLSSTATITVDIEDMNDNAPIFTQAEPVLNVSESTSVNTSIAIYTCTICPTTRFVMDPTTGVLSVMGALDREGNQQYYLTVEARDGGGLRTPVEVTVNILDANDNRPVFRRDDYEGIVMEEATSFIRQVKVEDDNDFTPEFTSAEYITSIPENSREGFVVKTVKAIDNDGTSPNNDFIYRIESGALDKFRINFGTGAIQVETGAELDREAKSEYTLTLSAIDRGTPPRTGYSTLKITLDDINDESPEFQPPTRSVTVNENTQVNSPVLLFSAVDSDLEPSLVYSFGEVMAYHFEHPDVDLDVDATGIKDYFGLNASTGQVFIKSELDREIADRVILQIVAEDTNAGVGQQTATGTLSVTIQDYNDNPPRFLPSSQYTVNVSEADSVQSIVLQVSATDADFDQTIEFSIGSATVDAFTIRNDGTILLKSKLNREAYEQVTFEVVARDNGSPPLTSTATVRVNVLDDNDNTPVFLPYETSFEVSEDVDVGYRVTKFSATDRDIGDFARITYTLAGPDNDDGSFVINSTTGELTVAKALDRESKASYRIEVVASDSPDNPEESKSRRSQSITITLLDVDDNAPVFTQLIPTAPFTVESSPVDQTIATVLAVDDDDSSTDNGRVIYSLTADTNATLRDGSPLFKIGANTGIIATASTLRGYAGYYYVTVMATNQARKHTPTRTIEIEVRDVNDDVPRFTKPSSDNVIAYVLENSDIGTSVFDLEAVDNDSGPNGEIRYTIVPLPNSDRDGSDKFRVDSISGLITTKSADLNAESQDKYELRIIATDQGFPDQYSTSLTMVVVILDKNEYKPEFDGFTAPHPISMTENTPDECVSVDLAVDRDLNTNYTRICYYLIGSSLLNTFTLDVGTGNLCLNTSLDREATPFVNIVIQALEDCYRTDIVTEKILPLEEGELYPSMFRPTYPDRLWIEIKVLDLNDNDPKFKSKDLALGVTRVTQFGRFILDLRADVTDGDSAKWGVDRFETETAFQAYPLALRDELDQLQVTEPFRVFPNGSVKTNMYFKPQMSGYFSVQLRVLDKGGRSDTASLRISLINDDQRLVIVFRRSIDSVGPIKDAVASRLSAKVGYRIVVDNIQTHEAVTGQADPAKTDMYIHGEDFATNEVIPAARLLSLIDQKNAMLVDLLNDYNVVELTLVNAEDLDDGVEDKLQMALILVSVVLGSICIILAIVLFYVHKRYERKLKAATAMAY